MWLLILLLAVANGALREAVLVPRFGLVAGQFASGVLLSAIVVLVALGTIDWIRPPGRAVSLGASWLVLTLVFEFGFGLVQGKGWDEMLRTYTFADGNIWPLVLLVVALAPPLARGVRRH